MPKYLAPLFLFLLACTVPARCLTHSERSIVEAAIAETVAITTEGRITCAAVFIGPHLLVTAAHCLRFRGMADGEEDLCLLIEKMDDDDQAELEGVVDQKAKCLTFSTVGQSVTYESHSRVKGSATVLSYDRDADLALMSAIVPSATWALLDASAAFAGEPLATVGHPSGLGWSYAPGYVASAHRSESGALSDVKQDMLQVSAPIWHGNSGGGAFNMAGSLVGIASFFRSNMPSCGYFVPAATILRFVHANAAQHPSHSNH